MLTRLNNYDKIKSQNKEKKEGNKNEVQLFGKHDYRY